MNPRLIIEIDVSGLSQAAIWLIVQNLATSCDMSISGYAVNQASIVRAEVQKR